MVACLLLEVPGAVLRLCVCARPVLTVALCARSIFGGSRVVGWLGFGNLTTVAWACFLVRE